MPELDDLVNRTNSEYMAAVDDEQEILETYLSRSRRGLPKRELSDEEIEAIDEASQRVQMKHLAYIDAFLAWNESEET